MSLRNFQALPCMLKTINNFHDKCFSTYVQSKPQPQPMALHGVKTRLANIGLTLRHKVVLSLYNHKAVIYEQ